MKTGIFYHKRTGEPVQIVAQAQTKPTFQSVICYQELTAPYEYFVMEHRDFFAEYVKEFDALPLGRQRQIGKREDLPDKQPRISKGVVARPEDEADTSGGTEDKEGSSGATGDETDLSGASQEDERTRQMLAFFDAGTYREKIKILESMKGQLDDRMLNNLAVSLDLSIEEDTDGYEMILSELQIRSKYESIRRD